DTTGAAGMGRHPAPEFRRLGGEAARGKQAQLAAVAALGIEHLHAGKVRAHDRHGRIEKLLVEDIDLAFAEEMRADLLEPLRGGKLARQALLIEEAVGVGREPAEACQEALILSLEAQRVVVRYGPDRADRLAAEVKRNQQGLNDRQRDSL